MFFLRAYILSWRMSIAIRRSLEELFKHSTRYHMNRSIPSCIYLILLIMSLFLSNFILYSSSSPMPSLNTLFMSFACSSTCCTQFYSFSPGTGAHDGSPFRASGLACSLCQMDEPSSSSNCCFLACMILSHMAFSQAALSAHDSASSADSVLDSSLGSGATFFFSA